MIYLIIKVILWLALAFALGLWLGWWLRRFKANAAQLEYEEQLLVLKDSKDSLATELDGKRQALLDAEATLGNKEQDLLNQTNELLRIQRLYSESGIKVAELEEETTQLSGELVLQQDQLTKLQTHLSEVAAEHEASVSNLLLERSTLADKLAMADQDLTATTARIGEFTTTQADLEARLRKAEAEVEQGSGKLQAKVTGLEQQHSKLQLLHQEQQANAKGLDKSNNQLETKVASLLAQLDQAQNSKARDAEQLAEQVASLQGQLTAASELAAQRERELDANNAAVSNNDEQVRRLTEDVRRWRSRIPDLQSELDEKEAQVRERDSRLATLDEQLSGRSQRLQASQQALLATRTNSTGPQQTQARIAQLSAQVSNLEGRVQTQQALLMGQQNSMTSQQKDARIAQLLAQLNRQKSEPAPVRAANPQQSQTAASTSAKAPTPISTTSATAQSSAAADERPASFYSSRPSQVDDLQRIKGIGPKLEGLLHELGVYQFAQVAKLTPSEVAWLDDRLNFKGRIERDEWIRQAQQFAS